MRRNDILENVQMVEYGEEDIRYSEMSTRQQVEGLVFCIVCLTVEAGIADVRVDANGGPGGSMTLMAGAEAVLVEE